MFKKEQLEAMLEAVGKHAAPMNIYLIGGCAMSFKGMKDETADIDIVVLKRTDLGDLSRALKKAAYKRATDLEEFYLSAVMVFQSSDGRIDLFVRDVCKQLVFSDRMVERASFYKKFGKLSVFLASNEDIFTFKGITDRDKDILDCITLLPGLDAATIISELGAQNERARWCFFLYEKLCLMEERGVQVPFKNAVRRVCKQYEAETPTDFLRAAKQKQKHWP